MAARIDSSRPSFSEMRSNDNPTLESGDSLVRGLASVTWPITLVSLGITILPLESRSMVILASILSPGFAFLASTDFDSAAGMSVPAGIASAPSFRCGAGEAVGICDRVPDDGAGV
jgi:hypothetical protein